MLLNIQHQEEKNLIELVLTTNASRCDQIKTKLLNRNYHYHYYESE